MSEQDNQESHPPQPTKDNRADYFKDIADFARKEIKWVASAYRLAFILIFALVAVGIFFTYKSSNDFKKEVREEVERLKTEVSKRIDDEFKKENIHKMVEEKAKSRIDEVADALIEKQIAEKITPQIKSAEEQLEKLKQRNEISQLGDRAISEASRDSLEELMKKWEEARDGDIKGTVKAEIARIKIFWVTATTTKGVTLTAHGEKKNESDIKTNELIEGLLNDNDWRVQALIAQELGKRKEKGVPEALLQCIKTNKNLEVIRNAVRAFNLVTGFDNPDVFAYSNAQNWWNEHSAEVNAKLTVPK